MTWGELAAAYPLARQKRPAATRDLAQVMDTHVVWQETGTGPDRALSLPALFAVVRLIASTIDQLDVTTTGGPAPNWLRKPRAYGAALDQGDMIQHLVTDMALRGSAFLQARRTGEGWRLDAVHHGSVGVQASTFGIVDLRFTFNGEDIERLPHNPAGPGPYLIHVPYLVTSDRPQGTSPVVEAWQSMAGYLAVEKQAAQLLDGGTYSGGYLETDAEISAETAKRFRESWVENRKSGQIPVLGAGLRYENTVISPRDATWIESRQANAAAIGAMFGVPPDLLGMALAGGQSSLSYANAQDNDRRFLRQALRAFTSQLEDALSPLLRTPGRTESEEQRVVFDYTAWMGDADAAPDDQA